MYSLAQEGAEIQEQILDESDAVGLMQLQCKEAKDDASAMIFPTTDTLSLQEQVRSVRIVVHALIVPAVYGKELGAFYADLDCFVWVGMLNQNVPLPPSQYEIGSRYVRLRT